ncbi:amidohydrolase family protein [Paralcaligenes sp. KSB-10]|uniref:amidohydrolase family protein n=1 Tax=Paralcaligenes sp. KSB-10 TaxID=2901142 RepID=UPI001E359DDA|nr:amidohydrolase family protein [Paralcaligenes sp. KSB-10]UHL63183.1 amidohydrolase family protein [Paralcaligenes sp. KSB-10]
MLSPVDAAPGYPGACDCHIHIYEEAYPLAASAVSRPPNAPLSAYRAMQPLLGLSRAILVQPTAYGADNRCLLAALEQLGAGARGIAVVPAGADEAELERFHRKGIRGVRYIMLAGGILPWDGLPESAAQCAALGWNINLQFDGREFPERESMLRGLPGRLVIDHTGKFLEPVAPDSEPFAALCRLLDGGRCWIKLSAPYETSRAGPPHYDDIACLASVLARRYPERCLWGSNWPHPGAATAPDDAQLLEWLRSLVDDESVCRKIWVDNPAELYGF